MHIGNQNPIKKGSSHQNGEDDGFAYDNFNNYFLVKLFLVKVMYYEVLNYKIRN